MISHSEHHSRSIGFGSLSLASPLPSPPLPSAPAPLPLPLRSRSAPAPLRSPPLARVAAPRRTAPSRRVASRPVLSRPVRPSVCAQISVRSYEHTCSRARVCAHVLVCACVLACLRACVRPRLLSFAKCSQPAGLRHVHLSMCARMDMGLCHGLAMVAMAQAAIVAANAPSTEPNGDPHQP